MLRPLAAAALLLALPAAALAAPPIVQAVRSGDARKVAELLDAGLDVNATFGSERFTPLKLAVRWNQPEIAKLLLDRGADVNARRNGTSALSLAAIQGDLAMVDLLLARGAEAAERDLQWARGPRRDVLVAHMKEAAARRPKEEAPALSSAPVPASGVDVPAYRIGEHADDFALVVGAEGYDAAPAAAFAERDAQAVRSHLIALGWPARNVVLLTGRSAGRAGFIRYVERWLPDNASSNGRFFFYFAGNGAADPKTGEPYLLPRDGDPALLESTGYPLARLLEKLAALKCRSLILVVDAAFAPGAARSASVPGAPPRLAFPGGTPDAVVLFAAAAGEGAAALEAPKHGALTYYLLKGLNGAAAAPSGAVTIRGLYDYARRSLADSRQTPALLTEALGEGDLRLR